MIQVAGGELADLKEGRAGIEQPLDAVAGKQLAARQMALARLLGAALGRLGDILAQLLRQRAVVRRARARFLARQVDLLSSRGALICQIPVCRNLLDAARSVPNATCKAAASDRRVNGEHNMRTEDHRPAARQRQPCLALPACRSGETDNQTEAVEGRQVGIDLAAMDKSVKPGDDFFRYANGTWFKNTEIPADRELDRRLPRTQQKLEKRMDELMAEIAKSDAAAGSNERKVADYRTAFMDQAGDRPAHASARSRPISTASWRSPTSGRWPRRSARPSAPTSIRSTPPTSTPKTCSACSSPSRCPNRREKYRLPAPGRPRPARPRILPLGRSGDGGDPRRLPPVHRQDAGRPGSTTPMHGPSGSMIWSSRSPRPSDDRRKRGQLQGRQSVEPGRLRQEGAGHRLGCLLPRRAAGDLPTIVVWHPEPTRKLAALVATEPLEAWKDWLAFHQIIQSGPVLPARCTRMTSPSTAPP